MKTIALDDLIFEPDINFRSSLDETTVERYRESVDSLPPLVVVNVPDQGYVVADGFHRGAALRLEDRTQVQCKVTEGSIYDARMISATANAKHGKPLKTAERDKAILWMVEGGMTHQAVANAIGIGRTAVMAALRRSGVPPNPERSELIREGLSKLDMSRDDIPSEKDRPAPGAGQTEIIRPDPPEWRDTNIEDKDAHPDEPSISVQEYAERVAEAKASSASLHYHETLARFSRLMQFTPQQVIQEVDSQYVDIALIEVPRYIEFLEGVVAEAKLRLEIYS